MARQPTSSVTAGDGAPTSVTAPPSALTPQGAIRHRIRQRVLDRLKTALQGESQVHFFDGSPSFIDGEAELPAVAVYLSDLQPEAVYFDSISWSGVLHVQIFLRAREPDAALDRWAECYAAPLLADPALLTPFDGDLAPLACDYQRDEELGIWGAIDLQYQIRYTQEQL